MVTDRRTGLTQWVKTGNGGRWVRGRLRTANTIQEQYERWMSETQGDEKKLKERVEYSADKVGEIRRFVQKIVQ